jgi:hypothetical protein
MTAKRRKRPPPAHAAPRPQTPAVRIVDKRGRPIPEWRWRTFPVLMALSTGLVVGYFLRYAGGPSTRGAGFWIYVAVLGFFSLCLAQLASRQVGDRIIRRRLRARGLPDETTPRAPPSSR